jgi:RHS repeat-associated protein
VDRKLFTGQERDAELGLDYFGARYYRNDAAQFTTPDPLMDLKTSLLDPQRWHRYSYVRHNPHRYVDSDGRRLVVAANLSRHASNEIWNALVDLLVHSEAPTSRSLPTTPESLGSKRLTSVD